MAAARAGARRATGSPRNPPAGGTGAQHAAARSPGRAVSRLRRKCAEEERAPLRAYGPVRRAGRRTQGGQISKGKNLSEPSISESARSQSLFFANSKPSAAQPAKIARRGPAAAATASRIRAVRLNRWMKGRRGPHLAPWGAAPHVMKYLLKCQTDRIPQQDTTSSGTGQRRCTAGRARQLTRRALAVGQRARDNHVLGGKQKGARR